MLILASTAFVITARKTESRRFAIPLVLLSFAVPLAVLEVAARLLLPPPPPVTPFEPQLLRWPENGAEPACFDLQQLEKGQSTGVQRAIGCVSPTRPDALRRILHVGDSLAYGLNLPEQDTFETILERRQPGIEHINAGIPGAAPDAYLVMMRRCLGLRPVDEVVFYLFAGNDLIDMDRGQSCSRGESILSYGPGGPVERFPPGTPPPGALRLAVARLRKEPAPYLAQALLCCSAADRLLVAAMLRLQNDDGPVGTEEVRSDHLERVLRAARNDLATGRRPFTVVVLPSRSSVVSGQPSHDASVLLEVSRRSGARTLDAYPALRAAFLAGRDIFQEDRVHLAREGNEVLATWLGENLSTVVAQPMSAAQ